MSTADQPPPSVALLQSCLACQTAVSRAALGDNSAGSFLAAAVAEISTTLDAKIVGVFESQPDGMALTNGTGWLPHIQPSVLPALDSPSSATPLADVAGLTDARYLRAHDVRNGLVCSLPLPGNSTAWLLVANSPHVDSEAARSLVGSVADVIAAGLGRRHLEDELVAGQRRLREAQDLAHLGSYDWNILADTNVWSDELFRIYGVEPGAFEPSYDEFLARVHPDDRDEIMATHRRAFESHEPWQVRERIVRPDGSVRILATTGEVVVDDTGTPVRMRGICIDMTDRVEADERRAELRRVDENRRQALELNDTVVQGLTSVVWAIEARVPDAALMAAKDALESARGMMTRMLDSGNGVDLEELRRTQPATGILAEQWTPPPSNPGVGRVRRAQVVIADDADDIRLLLRIQMELRGDCDLVGEASTGTEVVEVVARLQPDVVLLDVAMPGGSGIDAIPEIRRVAPDTAIVVLSGFSRDDLESVAVAAGAMGYVEKGSIDQLFEALETGLPDLFGGGSQLEPADS